MRGAAPGLDAKEVVEQLRTTATPLDPQQGGQAGAGQGGALALVNLAKAVAVTPSHAAHRAVTPQSDDEGSGGALLVTAALLIGLSIVGGVLLLRRRGMPQPADAGEFRHLDRRGVEQDEARPAVVPLLRATGRIRRHRQLGQQLDPVGAGLEGAQRQLDAFAVELLALAVAERVARHDLVVDTHQKLRGLLQQARSIDYAQRAAVDFVERAKRALYAFPPSPERDALSFLPDYVLSRDR